MSKKRYIIPIFVPHLGCPHDCIFCNQRKITNHKQVVDTQEIIDIIERHLSYFPKSSRTKEIAFFGGSFTAIDRNVMIKYLKIARSYKERGIIQEIRLSTRPDAISTEILDILKEYLVDIIELGVQSMNDEILKANNRGHDSKSVYDASMLIKDYGFTLGHQIMPGLYKDTFGDMIETARRSIEIGPHIVRIYPTLVIKDTYMEHLYKNKLYRPLSLEEAIDISSILLQMYKDKDIKVIRIGLQVTDNINLDNDVVAGPFHPALRQLVEQKIYLERIERLIDDKRLDAYDSLSITSNKAYISSLVGNKARNKNILINKYKLKKLSFSPIEEDKIYVVAGNNKYEVGVI
ncbi:MAG: radical SAM protein [Tissierellia bacterium]|nr:radical SAM protein [Tissierellia bacterium]